MQYVQSLRATSTTAFKRSLVNRANVRTVPTTGVGFPLRRASLSLVVSTRSRRTLAFGRDMALLELLRHVCPRVPEPQATRWIGAKIPAAIWKRSM